MRKITLSVLVLLVSVFFLAQSAFSQNILAVDRDGSADLGFTDCWPMYMAALDANGYMYTYFEVTDLTQDGPDLTTMMDFDIIVWFTGEGWASNQTMSDNDEANLASYLDAGGTLFFSGQDYLWDRFPSAGALSAGDFPYDYFGVTSVTQDNWVVETPNLADASGVAGSLADGFTFQVADIFTTTKDGLFIDMIDGTMGMDLFEANIPPGDGICGVQFDGGDFKTVFTTLSFAGITDPLIQADLMMNIVDYFYGGGTMCEDFDALTPGDLVAEQLGSPWNTWSGTSADDATVTDDQSVSPDNSFVVDAGAVDLIYEFGAAPLDAGQWLYSHYIYVPTGYSGYFNVQTEPVPGVGWNLDLFFDDGGDGHFDGQSSETFTYAQDTWIFVEINYDLDAGLGVVLFDGVEMLKFVNELTIGGIDYYGSDSGGDPGAYYDDVCFGPGWVITGIDDEESFTENNTTVFPNPATDRVTIRSNNIIDEVLIYNNMGQLVYSGPVDDDQIMVNTSTFVTGMYIVQVRTGNDVEVRKLIIE